MCVVRETDLRSEPCLMSSHHWQQRELLCYFWLLTHIMLKASTLLEYMIINSTAVDRVSCSSNLIKHGFLTKPEKILSSPGLIFIQKCNSILCCFSDYRMFCVDWIPLFVQSHKTRVFSNGVKFQTLSKFEKTSFCKLKVFDCKVFVWGGLSEEQNKSAFVFLSLNAERSGWNSRLNLWDVRWIQGLSIIFSLFFQKYYSQKTSEQTNKRDNFYRKHLRRFYWEEDLETSQMCPS